MTVLESTTALESEVRSYSRSWPVEFEKGAGSTVVDSTGREYLDFFAGAGALNYGHNHPRLKQLIIEHLTNDRLIHSLDMFTTVRSDFLRTFHELILRPRDLDYTVMFPGPAGTTGTEAALKLARKLSGRPNIVHFTGSFHGMTLGALAVTGNAKKRAGAGIPLSGGTALPYDGYLGADVDTLDLLERLLHDSSSGLDAPGGVIVESVQGEGGINVAGFDWLRRLRAITAEHRIPLILDDVQMGCGRTGGFFSFEDAGIEPDVVVISKSISGFGLPMALTLFRRDLDVWKPAEHNGTFRGIGPAFLTAAETLRLYWSDGAFEAETRRKGTLAHAALQAIVDAHPDAALSTRGRGLARGLVFPTGEQAAAVTEAAFQRGLVIETSGAFDEVVKLLPPLVVTDEELRRGLGILAEATAEVLAR